MSKSNLNLYLVSRNGNTEEGPDGLDTIFLVRALNYKAATRLVDKTLLSLNEPNVKPYSNWVCEIGKDTGDSKKTAIIYGPFIAITGAGGDYSKAWTRDYKEDGWISRTKEMRADSRRRRTFIRIQVK